MGTSGFSRGEDCEIRSTATIADGAVLGDRVRVGDRAIIGERVTVGDDSFIGTGVILGEPTRDYYRDPTAYQPDRTIIGARSIIRAHSCVYAGVTTGDELETGQFVLVRENSKIGSRCSIGSYSDIEGECRIGNGCRIHSSVHIAQFSVIGNYVWMFPYVLLLNDPIAPSPPGFELRGPDLGDFSVVLARAVIMPGVKLGQHVVVAANSRVAVDFGDWALVAGDPAREVCDSRRFIYVENREDGMTYLPYPWMVHHRSGYPWEDDIPPEWLSTPEAEPT